MNGFQALGWFEVPGIGWQAMILLDRDTDDFAHLVHQRIAIDGKPYVCLGVTHFDHPPPWRKGEEIGVVVKQRQLAEAL